MLHGYTAVCIRFHTAGTCLWNYIFFVFLWAISECVFLLASLNCSLSDSLRWKIINKTCVKMKQSSVVNSRDDKRSFMKFSSGFYIVYFVHFDEVNTEFVGVTWVIYLITIALSETFRPITVWLQSVSNNNNNTSWKHVCVSGCISGETQAYLLPRELLAAQVVEKTKKAPTFVWLNFNISLTTLKMVEQKWAGMQ